MNKTDEALEALILKAGINPVMQGSCYVMHPEALQAVIDEAIKQALEQQEPVAHINDNGVVHAAGYPWGEKENLRPLVFGDTPPAAQPAVQEPVGEKEISAWAERHDIQGTPTDLRSMFEDAASFTTPPAPKPVPVKTYHDGKPWPVAPKPWVGLTDEDKLHIEIMGGKSDVTLAEMVEDKLKERNV
jgi:hypothetical protein